MPAVMTDRLVTGILAVLTILLVLISLFSLQWRMVHDTPVMLYLSFLIDRFHEVPYRDFFDENMPGVYLTYYLVGKTLGYTDVGFRCADFLCLAAILVATWLWMRKLGRRAAWCGSVLFGLVYLGHGSIFSMQKDYVILLPTVLALLAASHRQFNVAVRSALIGFFFGMCALIKPQAAIGLPLVLMFTVLEGSGEGSAEFPGAARLVGASLASLAGFAAPLTAAAAYLLKNNALGNFLDMARNYWPLYHELTGYKTILTGPLRLKYLFWNYTLLGGLRLWLPPAALGAFISLLHPGLTVSQKRRVKLLIGLAICYSIYVLLAGKFWPYHWIPFSYFLILLSSLCVIKQPVERKEVIKKIPVAVLFITACFGIRLPHDFVNQIGGESPEPPKSGRVDEIAAYLKTHMRPGDKAQPLDWTGGAIHAMLIARMDLATSFYYDVPFYHHVSSEYVQGLRRRFIVELIAASPRFIIQIETDKPWLFGPDTTREFNELQLLLAREYHPVLQGRGYMIYERQPETWDRRKSKIG